MCEPNPAEEEREGTSMSGMSQTEKRPPLTTQRSWYYPSLYPSYKQRRREFRQLFPLSASQKFVVDYSCAYHRDILHQGRMYVSTTSCCFYSYIFGWENRVEVAWDQVVSITKEKTALFIPNAIQVETKEAKYFFASFVDRDSTFMMLSRLYQAALSNQLISEDDIDQLIACEYGEGDVNGICESEEEVEEGDEDKQAPPLTSDMQDTLDKWLTSTGGDSVVTVCDKIVNRPLGDMFKLLYSNSDFYFDFQKDRGTTELDVGEWEEREDDEGRSLQVREVRYNMSLSNPVGPKQCKVKETQTLKPESLEDRVYFVEVEAENSGVPYSDSFIVVTNSCLVEAGEGRARLLARAEIRFKKDLWGFLKDKIETNACTGIKSYYEQLANTLETYSESPPELDGQTIAGREGAVARSDALSVGGSLVQLTRQQHPLVVAVVMAALLLSFLNLVTLYRLEVTPSPQELPVPIPRDQAGWVNLLARQTARHSARHAHLRKQLMEAVSHVEKARGVLEQMGQDLGQWEEQEEGMSWVQELAKGEDEGVGDSSWDANGGGFCRSEEGASPCSTLEELEGRTIL